MNSTGEFARTCSGEGGRERRGLSAHSPSPRAKHPNPRSRNHERNSCEAAEASGARRGKKMDDSFSHTSSRKRRVMRQRFSQNYIQITKTACVNPKHIIYLSVRVIASDESRTRHGGIALLHRNHEVSGRRVSKAGRKRLFPGSGNLLMQITEKRQLPPLILEFTLLRNRSSSFEERESRGSSSNPCESFSAARESTSTSSE